MKSVVLLRHVFVLSLLFKASAFAGFTTVVIDAGHGGHDRGGIPGQRVAEKGMTLDVASRLRANLQAAGLNTVMTRNDDSFISLGRRVAIANSRRNAIFVSVHFNSAPRVGAQGIETYYYSGRSALLASRIHPKVVRAAGTEDRHIRRRGFYVIRNTRIPAVLVECGFLTNPQEANRVKDPAHRQRLANAIAAGVLAAR